MKSGDILAEIETDKATMEFEAVDEGKIGKILVPEGTEGVKVNQPIAELLVEGEAPGTVPDISSAMASIKPPRSGGERRVRGRLQTLRRKESSLPRSRAASPSRRASTSRT